MPPSAQPPAPPAALQNLLSRSPTTASTHRLNLAHQIQHNLQHQHAWSQLATHVRSPLTQLPLPRPLISGLPSKRVYIHPDEQTELLKHEMGSGDSNGRQTGHACAGGDSGIGGEPEREWVLPTHVGEIWTLKALAAVFDAVGTLPPAPLSVEREEIMEDEGESEEKKVGWQWRGLHRQKRILIATVHDDSTVVYYIAHDGIVKPRQN